MNKKELQCRAGMLTENYSLRAAGVTAFCMKDGLAWETDDIPPAPSDIERAQARSGHVDVAILNIKRLAGIVEMDINECPPEVQDIRAAAAKDIREELAELAKFMNFVPEKYKDRFDDRLDSIAHHLQDMEEQM
jgi:hypothetical protein